MDTHDNFSVYRLKIQSDEAASDADPYEFCKERDIIGIGWNYNRERFLDDEDFERIDAVPDQETAIDRHNEIADKYREVKDDDFTPTRVKQNGDLRAPLRYMISEMEEGDHVWVNEGSEFAVCQVDGA